MTWPNWNWELIEALGIVIGGLVLVLSLNRWFGKNNGRANAHSSGFPMSQIDEGYSLYWAGSQDTTNPATGLPMLGGVDSCGNPHGCDYRDD